VQASLESNEAHTVREEVECPSMSPDEKRVCFKKRVSAGLTVEWRLCVLDLATLVERRVEGEPRSVDDQVEWLEDAHVLYALRDAGPPPTLRPDVWSVGVDDGSQPVRLLTGAMSPCVVRP